MSSPSPDMFPQRADEPTLPDVTTLRDIQQRLLAWFAAHGRDLPWRHTRDPYAILVAEMMLQQTQVDRVLPKYAAFLQAFPTLTELAAAPTAEVIKQWAGLGYNRRAVNLQRVARAIRDEHGGVFPQDVAALRQLSGIGPYTAGAVACFAFEQDVAFADTNIRRVLRRLLAASDPAGSVPSDAVLHAAAQAMIPTGQGWAWNQAIMELGALICTSSAPACWRCPVQAHCRTYAAWRTADETVFTARDDAASSKTASGYSARTTASARRVAQRASQPFVGSNRYYRGRILDQLRALPAHSRMPLLQLGPRIKTDFDAAVELQWLRGLVAGLARDGLVEVVADEVGLPSQ